MFKTRIVSSIASMIMGAGANVLATLQGQTTGRSTKRPSFLGEAQPVDRKGQYRNPDRAAERRQTRALGGRRQALKTRKALRQMKSAILRAKAADAKRAAEAAEAVAAFYQTAQVA